MAGTLAEKVWNAHVVRRAEGEPDLLYIDLHLLHEVTSPQAFDGLRLAGRRVRRPDLDARPPRTTTSRPTPGPITDLGEPDPGRDPASQLRRSSASSCYPMGDADQGIVHVVGPQLGLTHAGHDDRLRRQPHLHPRRVRRAGVRHRHQRGRARARHADAAADARSRRWRSPSTGDLAEGVTAKDIVLAVIAKIGTAGGQGYVIEFRGSTIRALSMEARMTVCNMSIEAGARAGMIAPDQTTFDYLQGRPHAPTGADWDAAVAHWSDLRSDDDAIFDAEIGLDADELAPFVTWGTNPGQGLPLSASVPDPESFGNESDRANARRALEYMGLTAGTPLREIAGRHRLRRLVHQRPDRGPARRGGCRQGPHRSPTACAMLVVPGSARCGCRPRRRAWTRSSLDGGRRVAAARAARCAWA